MPRARRCPPPPDVGLQNALSLWDAYELSHMRLLRTMGGHQGRCRSLAAPDGSTTLSILGYGCPQQQAGTMPLPAQ